MKERAAKMNYIYISVGNNRLPACPRQVNFDPSRQLLDLPARPAGNLVSENTKFEPYKNRFWKILLAPTALTDVVMFLEFKI